MTKDQDGVSRLADKSNPVATDSAHAEKTPKRRAPSRAKVQRNEEIRLKLIQAAGEIIGEHGYPGCSIARVTDRAGIAHGAFNKHFSSQQDLFDAVLPTVGASMLQYIRQAIQNPRGIIDLERRGFEANFDYLTEHPYMYRVLTEAELYAPAAFKSHIEAMVNGYTRSLRRSHYAHNIDGYDDDELEAIATMLIGARTYLLMRYAVVDNAVTALPSETLDTYLKFISHGLAAFDAPPSDEADESADAGKPT